MELPAWLDFTERPVTLTIVIGLLVEVLVIAQAAYKQIYEHPLSKYPGPALGFLTTYRKAFIELVLRKSWHQELIDLHKKYGPVVRIGPNEVSLVVRYSQVIWLMPSPASLQRSKGIS